MSLSRNATGREFQRHGPATEKLLSPRCVRVFVAHVKTLADRSDRRPMSVKSWQSSARYCGRWPCNSLCPRTANLKSMRSINCSILPMLLTPFVPPDVWCVRCFMFYVIFYICTSCTIFIINNNNNTPPDRKPVGDKWTDRTVTNRSLSIDSQRLWFVIRFWRYINLFVCMYVCQQQPLGPGEWTATDMHPLANRAPLWLSPAQPVPYPVPSLSLSSSSLVQCTCI